MNIKDIAALAGVSAATVSKVLNRKDSDISEATREKVLKIVQEYQYVPYSRVRRNLMERNYTIGVVISEEYSIDSEFVYAIEKVASTLGYSVLFHRMNSEKSYMRRLENKNLDGLVIIGREEMASSVLDEVSLSSVPCICAGCNMSSRGIESFDTPQEEAAYKAASYLAARGHINIGCIAPETDSVARGLQRALYENRIEYDSSNIFSEDILKEEGRNDLREWLSQRYTAVIVSDTDGLLSLTQMLGEKGIMIPDDISVISLTDSRYLSMLTPRITSVCSYTDRFAEKIIGKIVSLIENKKFSEPEITIDITERGSVKNPDNSVGQKLVVVGSMNQDITITVPHVPTGGETLVTGNVTFIPGGKGANQAVGAAKLGARVYLIGCIGNDSVGKELYTGLLYHRIKMEGVRMEKTVPTGKAYIAVPESNGGESTIIIYQGANNYLDCEQIMLHRNLFDDAKFCLLSLEIPLETAKYVVSTCKEKGVSVIIKPSGVDHIDDELLEGVTYFVPNRKELSLLVPGDETLEEKAEYLMSKGVENVIVTLGRRGCYLRNENSSQYYGPAEFESVDSTGGADGFISALAVYLSEGMPLSKAIGFATYSGGITVTKQGVQPALPDREQLDMYRDDILQKFGSEN